MVIGVPDAVGVVVTAVVVVFVVVVVPVPELQPANPKLAATIKNNANILGNPIIFFFIKYLLLANIFVSVSVENFSIK
jgi:hypothetical protein